MLAYIKNLSFVVSIMKYLREWKSTYIEITTVPYSIDSKYGIILCSDYVYGSDKPIYTWEVKNTLNLYLGKKKISIHLPFNIVKPIVDSSEEDGEFKYLLEDVYYGMQLVRYKYVRRVKWVWVLHYGPETVYDNEYLKSKKIYEETFWSDSIPVKKYLLGLDGTKFKEVDINKSIEELHEYSKVVSSVYEVNLANAERIRVYREMITYAYGNNSFTVKLMRLFKKSYTRVKLVVVNADTNCKMDIIDVVDRPKDLSYVKKVLMSEYNQTESDIRLESVLVADVETIK